jgi:hypothetical protein
MVRVEPDPGLALDQVGDARGRPEGRVVAQSLRALAQTPLQVLQLPGTEFGLASRPTGTAEPVSALLPIRRVPTARRLAADLKATGDDRWLVSLVKQPRSLQATFSQRVKITFGSGGPIHAPNIAETFGVVTLFYRFQ